MVETILGLPTAAFVIGAGNLAVGAVNTAVSCANRSDIKKILNSTETIKNNQLTRDYAEALTKGVKNLINEEYNTLSGQIQYAAIGIPTQAVNGSLVPSDRSKMLSQISQSDQNQQISQNLEEIGKSMEKITQTLALQQNMINNLQNNARNYYQQPQQQRLSNPIVQQPQPQPQQYNWNYYQQPQPAVQPVVQQPQPQQYTSFQQMMAQQMQPPQQPVQPVVQPMPVQPQQNTNVFNEQQLAQIGILLENGLNAYIQKQQNNNG